MKAKWTRGGRDASARDLAEALALGRVHRRKQANAERESQERDAHARAVARSLQQSLRDHSRRRCSIACRPPSISGSRQGGVRLRRFELMGGLVHPVRFAGSGKRDSSFHFKFIGRGAGGHRRAKDRPYKVGEAVRAIRYILREAAREIEQGGIVGNISVDPNIVAGLFAAIEELELTAGRDNANVYMSLVVSLPHELTPDERKALLTQICAPLAEHDLPHVGVLHDPDPNGDRRNYHGHVMFSWRPFQCYGDGSYGFSEQTWAELNNAAFITAFRARAAEAMNEAMTVAGHARRFSPLSRAALGEAPADASDAKLTAGEKHASRRREDIAFGTVEQAMLEERRAALAQIEEATRTIIARAPLALDARLAALEATVTQRQRGQFANVPHAGTPGATEAAVVATSIAAGVQPHQLNLDPTVGASGIANVPSQIADAAVPDAVTVLPEEDHKRSSEVRADAPHAALPTVSHGKPHRQTPEKPTASPGASTAAAAESDNKRSRLSNLDVARKAAQNRLQTRLNKHEEDGSRQSVVPLAEVTFKPAAAPVEVPIMAKQPETWERVPSATAMTHTVPPDERLSETNDGSGGEDVVPPPMSLTKAAEIESEKRKKKKAVYPTELTDTAATTDTDADVSAARNAALSGSHGPQGGSGGGVLAPRDRGGR